MKSFLPFTRSARTLISVFALVALGSGSLIAGEPSLPTPTPTPASLIANLSTRLRCEKKDAVVVSEFAVQGPGTKYVILRGIGPSLGIAGVPDPLRDPTLTLLDAQGNVLDFNDNWVDSPDKRAIIATGIPPTDKHESAIVHTLSPGIYTSVLRGVQNTTGVAVSELYDLESFNGDHFSAVGTRGEVLTADNVMISGTILIGTGPVPVLLRVLGPSLAASGLSGVLADPTLELHDGSGALIASNDNWIDSPDKDAIIASGYAPDDDREPALIATLNPGAYTAIVRGVGGGATGIAFYQFYSLAVPGPELNPAPIIRGEH